MKQTIVRAALAATLCIVGVTSAMADKGRIPIYELPYTISQPGSYFVTRNLVGVSGQDGITIATDDVTLDLNGFTLTGVPGALTGIRALDFDDPNNNITIMNGTVREWTDGISVFVSNSRFIDLKAYNNANLGLGLGRQSIVTGSEAASNGGVGISCGRGCSVSHCIATSNGDVGILVSDGSTITNSAAIFNADAGISLGSGGVIADSAGNFNGGDGVQAGFNGTIRGGSFNGNGSDGIQLQSEGLVLENTCANNTAAGVHTLGFGKNRIEGNNVSDNAIGFEITGAGNLIIRNSARGNGNNYGSIAAGNTVGPIVDSTNIATDSNPHANYAF